MAKAAPPAPNLQAPNLLRWVVANDLLAIRGLSQAATCRKKHDRWAWHIETWGSSRSSTKHHKIAQVPCSSSVHFRPLEGYQRLLGVGLLPNAHNCICDKDQKDHQPDTTKIEMMIDWQVLEDVYRLRDTPTKSKGIILLSKKPSE